MATQNWRWHRVTRHIGGSAVECVMEEDRTCREVQVSGNNWLVYEDGEAQVYDRIAGRYVRPWQHTPDQIQAVRAQAWPQESR